jgi:Family of unknown function (DUF6069)
MSMSTPAGTMTAMAARRRARPLVVVGAVMVALVVWAVAELGFGIDLRSPANGSEASWDVNPAVVVATSGVASLAAWGLLALLERLTAYPRTVWTAIAVLALLISLGGPLSGTGVTGANRVALALMHLAVAAVLIPLLRRTAPNLRGATPWPEPRQPPGRDLHPSS